MQNKKKNIIILIGAIVVLIALLVFCCLWTNKSINISKNNKVEIMTEQEKMALKLDVHGVYKVDRNFQGKIKDYNMVAYKEVEITPRFMSDEDKVKFHFSPEAKVQIISTNGNQITAYRIIRDDSDILTRY